MYYIYISVKSIRYQYSVERVYINFNIFICLSIFQKKRYPPVPEFYFRVQHECDLLEDADVTFETTWRRRVNNTK